MSVAQLPALARGADAYVIAERVNVLIRDYNSGRVDDLAALLADTRTLQTASLETGAVATGTTIIPSDDTIPQQSGPAEGDEYMSLSITPERDDSELEIEVVIALSSSNNNVVLTAALFRDSGADAIAMAPSYVGYGIATGVMTNIKFTKRVASGSTSPTTFKVRAGASAAGTTTFNGANGLRLGGGALISSVVIRERLSS